VLLLEAALQGIKDLAVSVHHVGRTEASFIEAVAQMKASTSVSDALRLAVQSAKVERMAARCLRARIERDLAQVVEEVAVRRRELIALGVLRGV
jgi:hypothetical protein